MTAIYAIKYKITTPIVYGTRKRLTNKKLMLKQAVTDSYSDIAQGKKHTKRRPDGKECINLASISIGTQEQQNAFR